MQGRSNGVGCSAGRFPRHTAAPAGGYPAICHTNRKTKVPTGYPRTPSLNLKGNWLAEAGFDTVTGVTVKILEGCIVLMAESNEVQELREVTLSGKTDG